MKRLILLASVLALIPLAGCVYRPYGYSHGYYGGRYDDGYYRGSYGDRYGRDYRDRDGDDRSRYYDRDYYNR